MTHEKLYKIQISVSIIKLYGNLATLIHLHPVSGYFHATRAELNICDRGRMARKAYIFTPWLFAEKCAEPWNKQASGRIARKRDVSSRERRIWDAQHVLKKNMHANAEEMLNIIALLKVNLNVSFFTVFLFFFLIFKILSLFIF